MYDLTTHPFKAIIFDCDGTLADNMPLHYAAWEYALQQNGATMKLTPDLILQHAGKGILDIVPIFNETYGQQLVPERVAEAKDEYFEQHHETIKPIPEVMEVVLRYRGSVPMAVASGSRTKSVRRTLKHLGIMDWFEPIISVDDVASGKPAPDMFLLAANQMGVTPGDCVVFEDGELGIQAAEACGMKWYRVKSRL